MKITTYMFLVLFISFSCSGSVEEGWTEIKDSQSIKEYQDYLINHPQTVHASEIRSGLKQLWEQYAAEQWAQCNWERNTLILSIDKDGQIFFENEKIEKTALSDKIEYALSNPYNSIFLPDKEELDVEGLEAIAVSRGVINVNADKDVDSQEYAGVIMLLRRSYERMRNECAMHLYEKPLKELTKAEKKNIEAIVPMRIRLECYVEKISQASSLAQPEVLQDSLPT